MSIFLPENPLNWLNLFNKEVKPRLDKPIGIIFLFLIIYVIIWSLHKLSGIPGIFSQIGLNTELFIVALVLSLVCWLYLRKIPRFSFDEVGILMTLSLVNNEGDKELTLLSRKLQSILYKESLKTRVVLRFLPSRLVPKNEKDAHNIKEKTNAQLIIWGDVDAGNFEDEKQTIFKPIYFSYRIHLPKDKVDILNKNFNALLGQRKWIISERNNVVQREYLATNLEEIAFYVIGLVLYFANDSEKALELLVATLKKYENKESLSDNDKIAIYNIRIVISFIFTEKINFLELWPNSVNKESHLKLAEEFVKQLTDLNMFGPVKMLSAIISFHNNKIDEAIKLSEESEIYTSIDDPAPKLSQAFLYFYKEDIVNGFRKLQKAIKSNELMGVGNQSVSLIRWYEDLIHLNPDRKYLNYPLGILYYELSGDKILAKECLSYFKQEYNDSLDKVIIKMCYEAEKRLRKVI
ncbi:MAG: hypothetical protein KW806_00520 [Candidatus Yanofskybacteria bacterium]|nr:hypothetical protein [Candidatus Yanofskybacteria bacterium]